MNLNNVLLYIDPGTGSIILQAIVATVAGLFLFFKLGWHRLLRFFRIKKGDKDDPEVE